MKAGGQNDFFGSWYQVMLFVESFMHLEFKWNIVSSLLYHRLFSMTIWLFQMKESEQVG